MGSDFVPTTWEILLQIIDQLASKLFDDKSLVEKHRERLQKLKWSKCLGKVKLLDFVQAHITCMHKGVWDSSGKPVNTPHDMFVDNDVHAKVFDEEQINRQLPQGLKRSSLSWVS